MSLSINTNVISLTVQRSFNSSTNKMNDAMEKMTTGFKINSAADDAAGYGVVKNMESIISTYSVAETNGQMGSSLLQTQEGVLGIIGDYLQRIRDLTEQAANGTYATSSRNAIASEVSQRMSEINRLCEVTDFNGLKLLDGSQTDGVNLQVGVNSGMENVITLNKDLFASGKTSSLMQLTTGGGQDMTYLNQTDYDTLDDKAKESYYAADVGGTAIYCKSAMMAALVDGSVATASAPGTSGSVAIANGGGAATITAMCANVFSNDNAAREFLNTVDLAVNNVTSRASEIGSYMNRVDSAVESLGIQSDNLTEGKSLIKDADVAKVSSEYLSYQILQQAGASMLTTANQTPSIALNLI